MEHSVAYFRDGGVAREVCEVFYPRGVFMVDIADSGSLERRVFWYRDPANVPAVQETVRHVAILLYHESGVRGPGRLARGLRGLLACADDEGVREGGCCGGY